MKRIKERLMTIKGLSYLITGGVLLLLIMACSRKPVEYAPGQTVPDKVLESIGTDTFFCSQEIPDDIFEFMQGRSFKEDCTVPRSDLRYLLFLHRNLDGNAVVGEMVVNRQIANDVLDIMKQLFYGSYPIEHARLIDYYDADDEKSMAANNTSCFNWRSKAGSANISKHAMGMAIDINPLYNPYYKFPDVDGTIKPSNGKPYIDRMWSFPYRIEEGDLCHRLFVEHGFRWGGSWNSLRDYQHFEK